MSPTLQPEAGAVKPNPLRWTARVAIVALIAFIGLAIWALGYFQSSQATEQSSTAVNNAAAVTTTIAIPDPQSPSSKASTSDQVIPCTTKEVNAKERATDAQSEPAYLQVGVTHGSTDLNHTGKTKAHAVGGKVSHKAKSQGHKTLLRHQRNHK